MAFVLCPTCNPNLPQSSTSLNGDGFSFFIENGEFLSLDLGGSKFRVLKVQVSEEGKRNVQMESQFYPTPNEIIRGNGVEVLAGGEGLSLSHEKPSLTQCPVLSLPAAV